MPNTGKIFSLLNEFIVLLLGALLIALAVSGRVGPPGRPAALVVPEIVLIYWGFRAWIRRVLVEDRLQSRVRAGSLVLVGLLVLGIRYLPLRNAEFLLELAGGILIVRGLLGGVLLVRQK
jgi:hypothetical protein